MANSIETVDPYGTLELIATKLRNGDKRSPITVRKLLSWFNQQRRGVYVVDHIRQSLRENGLRTFPDFEGAFIDSFIEFELASGEGIGGNIPSSGAVTEGEPESVFRIRILPSANRAPLCVSPTTSVGEAITLMLHSDFSQLPVVCGPRSIKGLVTWKSIGEAYALDRPPMTVSDCMEAAVAKGSDTPLLKAITDIVEHTCILVRAPDQTLCGIVTTADLSEQFRQLTEPFLVISEIERQLREMISVQIDNNKKKKWRNKGMGGIDESKSTFGDYVSLFGKPEAWSDLNTEIHQKTFVQKLDRVREIRNDVMHFNADPTDDETLCELRNFSRLLEKLAGHKKPSAQDKK